MARYFADFHIHIGRTRSGRPVKITGAKSLTFSNIISHARNEKGLDMIGIIDCHSPEVILEMESLIESGEMAKQAGGGLLFGDMAVIPGSELEIYDELCKGPIHVLCFMPGIEEMKEFSAWLSERMKNVNLSSQRIYTSGRGLQEKVKQLGGLFIPAHVFTPFKSLYGKGVSQSLAEVFNPDMIDGIELGLSSDTKMADGLAELHRYPFLTNSDAHSLAKIAREYQMIKMNEPSFMEFSMALRGEGGRRILANYGLDPYLGKYHGTVCADCLSPLATEGEPCGECGSRKIVKGVADRISELSTAQDGPEGRPPYVHQVPLEFIPGLGPKLLQKLLWHFGTEMAILHEVPQEAMEKIIPEKLVNLIILAREGKLSLKAGGGGKYGKVEY
ncbi:endonuclease Q family protein [Neobacillus sp. YIM B06451]|uniref:endonuclease Q family protein n=1 Tax=Neobacillus sp. YIM B06451 TaxID=3070994 RepID=UPI00293004A0|nr:endonuclease Q family protein [Neobacillus sp. YIM B06451]